MSESENTVRYLADAARRRGSRDQSVGPAEPEPTRSGGRRARAGFDGAQGFANRMLGDQDEHDGGPPRPDASPTLDEQINQTLRRSQPRRRITKLPMIPSAHSARMTPEAGGTLAASPPGAFRRHRPRVKVARKRNISARGWGRMMVAVTVAAAVLAGLIIAKPGHSGSSGQPISSHSGTVAAVSYDRHGSLALTSGFLRQEARAEALAAARRERAMKRRLGHFEVGIAIASARDLVQLPQRDQASHYVTPAATSQPNASSASASATSSTTQGTTATSPTYTPPAPSSGGGSSSTGGGSSSSGGTSSGGSSSTKSGSTPAFGSRGALGPGYSPDS
jgi:uncharacterized membrane protein YgcG